jgi:hypothetical protein
VGPDGENSMTENTLVELLIECARTLVSAGKNNEAGEVVAAALIILNKYVPDED